MKRLELELFRCDTLVFGRVLHQDENLRKSGKEKKVWGYDEFEIRSMDCPQLMRDTLFVKGEDRQMDDRVFFYDYLNEKEAKSAVEKIKKLVDKINGGPKETTKVIKEI